MLSSSAQGAKIYFTDDGSKPDSESTLYVSPIEGVPGTTYSAVATADRMRDSATEAITYSDSGFWMRDVKPGDWYYGVIDEAAFLGILNGTGNFRYQPGKSTTRAMAITMLYRLASPAEDFERIAPDDVAEGKYYYDHEIVKVPSGKVARQVGIFKYTSGGGLDRTVPVVKFMDK